MLDTTDARAMTKGREGKGREIVRLMLKEFIVQWRTKENKQIFLIQCNSTMIRENTACRTSVKTIQPPLDHPPQEIPQRGLGG